MGTVAEIESAIGKLPANEMRRLLDRLSAKSTNGSNKPKFDSILPRLHPGCHLAGFQPFNSGEFVKFASKVFESVPIGAPPLLKPFAQSPDLLRMFRTFPK